MEGNERQTSQVLLRHKEHQSVLQFAEALEMIAKRLQETETFTFVQGTEPIKVSPTEPLKVEYKYTKKGEKHSFKIEFDWYTGAKEHKTMRIE